VAAGERTAPGTWRAAIIFATKPSGEVSPLLSAFEAAMAEPMPGGMVDAFLAAVTPGPELDQRLQDLEEACHGTEDPGVLRPALDQLSWALLDATLSAVDQPVLARPPS
jgi:hypothetical protein